MGPACEKATSAWHDGVHGRVYDRPRAGACEDDEGAEDESLVRDRGGRWVNAGSAEFGFEEPWRRAAARGPTRGAGVECLTRVGRWVASRYRGRGRRAPLSRLRQGNRNRPCEPTRQSLRTVCSAWGARLSVTLSARFPARYCQGRPARAKRNRFRTSATRSLSLRFGSLSSKVVTCPASADDERLGASVLTGREHQTRPQRCLSTSQRLVTYTFMCLLCRVMSSCGGVLACRHGTATFAV